jgi:TRAP-type C4-dicarboxylate transport system permease small subunit
MSRILRSSLVHAAFGFLLMGGWTLWANRAHGLAWVPALAQGLLSAGLTALLKKTLERLDGRFAGVVALALPPAITAGAILATLTLVHRLIGTPELLATIAFPWTMSTLYAIAYNARLVADRRKAAP